MNVPVSVVSGLLLAVLTRLVEVTAVKTTSAPSACIDSTFTGLACSGMQIIARTPNRFAA